MKYGWQLKESSWIQLKEAVSVCEWRKVYLESMYESSIPKGKGVYLICATPKYTAIEGSVMEHLYNAIYAGQTFDLNRRFKEHVQGYGRVGDAKKIFRRLDFWYSEVEDNILDEIEQLLIDTIGPTGNVINVKARIGYAVPAGRIRGELI